MTVLSFRAAGPDDTEQVAMLHADSWRRHYRGAYADSFLDSDVVADRRATWSSRLATPANSMTVLAEDGARLAGFVHVIFDLDEQWGSLLDNLHVVHDRHRIGIGTRLMAHAAEGVAERAASSSMYLWVLAQNTTAQRFYYGLGGTCVETSTVPAATPGGNPARLNGSPGCIRIAWSDVASLRSGASSRRMARIRSSPVRLSSRSPNA